MRKILSLLLILALFLPCALAETPQGIDLALTSTYGDGLSLRMTAGLGETPFCSLTLPSGQIDLAFSPDKGLCVQSGGQWAQLLVEGHPVDAALLTTPLKLLDGRSPSEVLGLLAEDVNKMLDAIPSLYNLPMTLIRDPAFARLFSDLYIAAQTGTISITSEELNRMAASVLGKIYSMEYLDGLNFSDIYHHLLASVVQSSEVARAYRSAMRGYLLSNFRLSGDLHYKAEWRLAEYTITMDLDGGSGQEKVVYTITDEEFELPTPTRNGYEFVGWTGERITTPQTSVKIPKGSTGNKAYTANWKVIRYTITLVTNGGAVIASIPYTVEDSVTLPIPPDRPGYEFSGWTLDGSGQFPSTPMIIPKGSTGDRIYKEEWRVATYTITYVSHGKAYNWVQYTINNQVYFGTPEEDPSYYLPGYTFVGWKIDGVEGTPRSYMLPKGSYGNRTATMLWEAIP